MGRDTSANRTIKQVRSLCVTLLIAVAQLCAWADEPVKDLPSKGVSLMGTWRPLGLESIDNSVPRLHLGQNEMFMMTAQDGKSFKGKYQVEMVDEKRKLTATFQPSGRVLEFWVTALTKTEMTLKNVSTNRITQYQRLQQKSRPRP